MVLRVVGEGAEAARAHGLRRELTVRLLATVVGGFLAGIGGSFLSLFYPGSWNEGLSSGQGPDGGRPRDLRALGPVRCLFASLLFGGAERPRARAAVRRHDLRVLSVQRRAPTLLDAGHSWSRQSSATRAFGRTMPAELGVGALTHLIRRLAMTFVPANPYPWPYDGDARGPRTPPSIVIDMQTDFCGKGGYIDLLGYDLSIDARVHRADPERPLASARARLSRDCTPAKGTAPTCPICPPTSAGARACCRRRPGPAGHRRPGAVRARAGARRARLGDHPRARAAAGRADHRQAGQGLVLRDRSRHAPAPARHPEHRAHGHHHATCACTPRCARPTTAATSA